MNRNKLLAKRCHRSLVAISFSGLLAISFALASYAVLQEVYAEPPEVVGCPEDLKFVIEASNGKCRHKVITGPPKMD